MIGGAKDWEWDVHSVWRVENQKAQEVRFTGKQDFERLQFELKFKKKIQWNMLLWIIQQACASHGQRWQKEEGSHLIRDVGITGVFVSI